MLYHNLKCCVVGHIVVYYQILPKGYTAVLYFQVLPSGDCIVWKQHLLILHLIVIRNWNQIILLFYKISRFHTKKLIKLKHSLDWDWRNAAILKTKIQMILEQLVQINTVNDVKCFDIACKKFCIVMIPLDVLLYVIEIGCCCMIFSITSVLERARQ